MFSKHIFSTLNWMLISGVILLQSCSNNSKPNAEEEALKGHLSTSLVENPRSLSDDSTKISELGHLAFVDTLHHFGKIKEGELVSYEFEFQNTGKKDVIISEAHASCGCTVPDYPTAPIHSGQKQRIKVTFNSQDKVGMNEKMIYVNTNANPSVYNLYIEAEVEAK